MTTEEKGVINAGENEDGSKKQKGFDFDGYWKELILRFFYPLLKRAIPELYKDADTALEPRYLDKEFTDILNTADREIRMSPYHADLVIEVPMRKKERAEFVTLHVESQRPGGGNIARRMNHYRSMINAHYNREPVALAIITGGRRKKERSYAHSHYGTKVSYEYNHLVLSELDDDELKSSDNPIDITLYAAKCASRAKEELQKLNYMRTLLDLLSERGWSKDDKRDLLLFLERIIDLRDKDLERQYVEYRSQLSEEGKIMYIPLGERELAREIEQRGILKGMAEGMTRGMTQGMAEGMVQGMTQGMAQGLTQGKEEMARNLLADGFPPEVIAKNAGLSVERVRSLVS